MAAIVRYVRVAARPVGPGYPCFVIAEAGVNHNGRVELAERLVDAAAAAGADAVKFQTFDARQLASSAAPTAAYQRAAGAGGSQVEMLARLQLPVEAFGRLQARARARKLLFLSSPFDEASVEVLDRLRVPAFKVGSGELTNWPLLERIARKGVSVLLSTGMSDLREVREAVRVLRDAGNGQLVLLHCVSNYPADPADANLRAMRTMADACRVPVGYSDHTLGLEVALAAVALGACVLEKHLTLDRALPGSDHRASLEPDEFRRLVQGIRTVERALGHGRKEPVASERAIAAVARKSLVAAQDISRGTVVTEDLIAIRRPGSGLAPGLRPQLVGRVVTEDVPAGTVLTWAMVAKGRGAGPARRGHRVIGAARALT